MYSRSGRNNLTWFLKKGLNIVSLNLANMISDQVSSSFLSVVSLIICTFSYARITLRRTMTQKKWCATIVLSEIWIFCPRARHSFLWTLRSIREIEDAVESKGFPPFFCANLVSDTIDTNDIGLHSMLVLQSFAFCFWGWVSSSAVRTDPPC